MTFAPTGLARGTMEPITTEVLTDVLKRAAQAHGVHEEQLGRPDPDWPEWYAARTPAEDGYLLSRPDAH